MTCISSLFYSYIFRLRAQILKYLHSRHVLILGCVLVVLECMCIMAELMVDLQGIRSKYRCLTWKLHIIACLNTIGLQ